MSLACAGAGCSRAHPGAASSSANDADSGVQGKAGSANAPPPMFDNSSPEDRRSAEEPPPPDPQAMCMPSDAQLVSVDSSSCAERMPQPCGDGSTAQAQLNNAFADLLRSLKLWPDLGGALSIVLENGCPIGFYNHFAFYDAAETTKFGDALAEIRWACAQDLSCALIRGAVK
jgi:hypothetical protein